MDAKKDEKEADTRTPFERLKDFTEKIVRVRKSEIPKHAPTRPYVDRSKPGGRSG